MKLNTKHKLTGQLVRYVLERSQEVLRNVTGPFRVARELKEARRPAAGLVGAHWRYECSSWQELLDHAFHVVPACQHPVADDPAVKAR